MCTEIFCCRITCDIYDKSIEVHEGRMTQAYSITQVLKAREGHDYFG